MKTRPHPLLLAIPLLTLLLGSLVLALPILAKETPKPLPMGPGAEQESLGRAQLAEDLIRSDASSVMLGEWLAADHDGASSR